jgi:protein SCO1
VTPAARRIALVGGGLAVGLAAVVGPAQASFYNRHQKVLPNMGQPSDVGPVSGADIDIIENLGQKVPRGLFFTDGHGGRVALDDLLARGKPVLLTLGYYHCPMLCNLIHEGLAKGITGSKLVPGQDFVGLAVSVDPKEDPKSANTQQGRLLRAIQHQDKASWPFVFDTSEESAAVKSLARAVGFRYKYDPSSKQFAHAAVALVIAPNGMISRYLYGVEFLPRDLRLAVVEAGGGRVGTTLDRVLLACFRYDPMAQRYTPFALAFVRIGAGLSFMALAILMAVLWRRELLMRRRRMA